MSQRQFVARVLIVIGLVALALLLWQLRHLFLLVFGAVLVAVIFRIIANPIARRFGIPRGIALMIAVLSVLGLFAVAFWLFGSELIRQAETLRQSVPRAWEVLRARLEGFGLGGQVDEWIKGLQSGGGGLFSNLGNVALAIGNGVTDALLVLVGGIYLAAQPPLYRSGFLKLLPQGVRDNVERGLEDSWTALRLWLLGRLVSMTIVGLLTGIGLWLIGIPGALALAIVAFILEFVPFVGPILSSIPAILLALAHDPVKALWVAGLYLVVQQIEGNVVEPLVQQRAVDLPPALLLFSLVAGGMLFGGLGIVLAAPLLVVLYVLVKRLYVRDTLKTPTPIPGQDGA